MIVLNFENELIRFKLVFKTSFKMIAIHPVEGSFSDIWIPYCKENNIFFKEVNCYDTNIINHLEDCQYLLWHHQHNNYKDLLFAKELLYSLELAGKKVFPNFNTGWYFDDKVAQKYLLESIKAPLVPSFVFFDKKNALEWAKNTTFPKVLKLRGGAGASNVSLVKGFEDCKRKINKAFGKGFLQYNRYNSFKQRWSRFLKSKKTLDLTKAVGRFFILPELARKYKREKGYIYFQEFIPYNKFDIRIIVIDKKAFAIKRMNREGDFRASGSGFIIYDKNQINIDCVKIAFDVDKKLKTQCVAFDFIFNETGKPLIVEISFGYNYLGYLSCEGYWDDKLNWHQELITPEIWVLENLIKKTT